MHRFFILIAFGLLITLSSPVINAQEPPSEEYVQAMRDIGSAIKTLMSSGGYEDFEGASKAAQSAVDAFVIVEEYWVARGDKEAANIAATAKKAAADLRVVANLNSSEGVEFAVGELTATCMSCHAAHREKAADGSFLIK